MERTEFCGNPEKHLNEFGHPGKKSDTYPNLLLAGITSNCTRSKPKMAADCWRFWYNITYNVPSGKYATLPSGITQIRMARTDYSAPSGVSGTWVTQCIGTQAISGGPPILERDKFAKFGTITDGLSNTLFLVEDAGRPFRYGRGFVKRGADRDGHGAAGGWGDPDSWFGIGGANAALGTQGNGPTAVNGSSDNEIYAFHPGGANVLLGDGSVRFLSENVTLAMIAAFVSRQGGEILPDEVQ